MVGLLKAYMTRVGEGPFPTELHGKVEQFAGELPAAALADAASRMDSLAPLLAKPKPTPISAIAPHTQAVKVSPNMRNAQITLAATTTSQISVSMYIYAFGNESFATQGNPPTG